MTFIKEQHEKLKAAFAEPYLLEQVEKLEEIRTSVESVLREHDRKARDASDVLGSRLFFGATVLGAGVAIGGAMAIGFPGYLTGLFTMAAGIIGGVVYCQRSSVKANCEKKYYKKHESEIMALGDLRNWVTKEIDDRVKMFKDMTPAEHAGLVHFEKLATTIAPLREAFLNSFRKSVSEPVFEQRTVLGTSPETEYEPK